MIFCRIVLGIVVYILTVIWGIAVEPRLRICFFNTGQGNCIALRSDVIDQNSVESKLIFIDCGCGITGESGYKESLLDVSEYPGKKLESLFNGISECEVLVTHNHQDHTNLISSITEVCEPKGCSVVDPIKPISSTKVFPKKNRRNLAQHTPRVVEMLEKDWYDFCDILPRIRNSLGPYVRVVPMRPERWKDNKAQSPEHDFNIVYLVDFAGRKILFLGDVSPQLFTQIRSIPEYGREIDGVDYCVLSHHGTNQSGELLECAKNSEMCMICSDPHGINNLPWGEIAN